LQPGDRNGFIVAILGLFSYYSLPIPPHSLLTRHSPVYIYSYLQMSADSSAFVPLTPAPIFDMLQGHQRTAALKAAIELDLFRAIGDGPGDVASIARQCSTSERGTRILCDFLTINGVLAKHHGHYSHTPMSGVFLDPRSPACMASVATFLSNRQMLDTYHDLTEMVRTGHTVLPGAGTIEPENPLWVDFAVSMAPLNGALAPAFCDYVIAGRTGPLRVLDIAAGHGLFGIEIAKNYPAAQITALDWAAVLRVALVNAELAGITDRYSLLPGSAFDLAFPGPCDAVLLTNFLHHFDPPTCISLLKKIYDALAPRGLVAALEFVPNEDRVTPPLAAAFSMTMLASTIAGDAYPLSELSAMYTAAGFHDITAHPIPMSPSTVVMGIK
jgi:SAM-dependent methyltransferase